MHRHGAVAQLGERHNRTVEAGGSSPPSSTTVSDTANSAIQSDFGSVLVPCGTVLRRGDRIDNRRSARPDQHLLDEGTHEGFGLGEFASPEKLAYVPGEGDDGVGVVQRFLPL